MKVKKNIYTKCNCGSGIKFRDCCGTGISVSLTISPLKQADINSSYFKTVFLGEGSVFLSDELCNILADKWNAPLSDLEHARDQGARYCKDRDSLLFPPEIG